MKTLVVYDHSDNVKAQMAFAERKVVGFVKILGENRIAGLALSAAPDARRYIESTLPLFDCLIAAAPDAAEKGYFIGFRTLGCGIPIIAMPTPGQCAALRSQFAGAIRNRLFTGFPEYVATDVLDVAREWSLERQEMFRRHISTGKLAILASDYAPGRHMPARPDDTRGEVLPFTPQPR
ncbi:MAG: hypothetical protein KGI37_07010 [Alphaproteobacteria bacterium]|nr:hypothetical protein [Alphaproteobacteria bacterium]